MKTLLSFADARIAVTRTASTKAAMRSSGLGGPGAGATDAGVAPAATGLGPFCGLEPDGTVDDALVAEFAADVVPGCGEGVWTAVGADAVFVDPADGPAAPGDDVEAAGAVSGLVVAIPAGLVSVTRVV